MISDTRDTHAPVSNCICTFWDLTQMSTTGKHRLQFRLLPTTTTRGRNTQIVYSLYTTERSMHLHVTWCRGSMQEQWRQSSFSERSFSALRILKTWWPHPSMTQQGLNNATCVCHIHQEKMKLTYLRFAYCICTRLKRCHLWGNFVWSCSNCFCCCCCFVVVFFKNNILFFVWSCKVLRYSFIKYRIKFQRSCQCRSCVYYTKAFDLAKSNCWQIGLGLPNISSQ